VPTTDLSHRFEKVEFLPPGEQIRVLKQEVDRLNKWNLRLQRAIERFLHDGDKQAVLNCLRNDGVS